MNQPHRKTHVPGLTLPAALALMWLPALGLAEAVSRPHVTAELISRQTSFRPGDTIDVGVRLQLEEGWHVYWRNPGDAGLSTQIDWTLPPGFEAGPIRWPYPHRFALGPVVSFGHSGDVLLLVKLRTPGDLAPDEPVELIVNVSWLICKDVCLPGKATLTLELPVAKGNPAVNESLAATFEAAENALPRVDSTWRLSAGYAGDRIELRVEGPTERLSDMAEAMFFPTEPGLIAPSAEQPLSLADGRLSLSLQPVPENMASILHLQGVLVADSGWDDTGQLKALQVDVPVRASFAEAPTTPQGEEPTQALSIATAVAFALLGGLILNIMPCVFPVLSIKILTFVNQAGGDRAVTRRHGYVFALGVIVSFWVLAGLLLALRAGGQKLGWGFQLQSPGFVAAMALLLFAVGLNLVGVFEVGGGMIGLASKMSGQSGSGHGGYGGSFSSGILATLLATPCAAPFMATAVGAALALRPVTAMLVFTCLGVGMAAPYVLLSLAPQLLSWLPRPGPWMESFKQFMAFPLFATTAWLASVFGQQTGDGGLVTLLMGLVLLAIGAWIWGRWTIPSRGKGVRRAAGVIAGIVVVCSIVVSLGAGRSSDDALQWEPYSPQRLEELRADGRMVFVDFTATWCLTCKVNELVALSSTEVVEKFRQNDVALLKGDWTLKDPTITKALDEFGRSSVPLYLLYGPNGSAEPKVLPTVLTPQIVVRAVDNVKYDGSTID